METTREAMVQKKSASAETNQESGGKSGFLPHPEMAALQGGVNQSPQVQQFKTLQRKVNAGVQPVQIKKSSINKNSGTLNNHSNAAQNLGINKTNVNFTGAKLNSTGEEAGVKMVASCIGPDHPQGSGPNTAVTKNHINHFHTNTKDTFIRGHLLNGDLGGPGEALNLFPITAKANSLHYHQVENQVKTLVNDQKCYAYYEVEIANRKDNNAEADIKCKLWPLDTNGNPTKWQLISTIHSEPSNSNATTKVSNLSNQNAIDTETQLGNNDIEYQSGKMPVGYESIEKGILKRMKTDANQYNYVGSVLEDNLKNIGIGKEGIIEIQNYIDTGDSAVFKNLTVGAWNRWANIINDQY
jgi:hypothetical protein